MKNCMPFLSALSTNLTLEYQPCFAIDYNTLYGSKSYSSFNLVKYTRLYDMPQAKRWAKLTRKNTNTPLMWYECNDAWFDWTKKALPSQDSW